MRPLQKKLRAFSEKNMLSFHTPGHKGRQELFADILFPQYDLTELPGLDMLHAPEGVIADSQKTAAELFGAEETYYLINGASAGNQAMMLALASSCIKGNRVRIERQSHFSVTSGLILSGLLPEYIMPEIHPDFHLPLGLAEEEFYQNPEDVSAFHLTYPTYYGSASNIAEIINYRDEHLSNVPVLVDQAHGSHYRGSIFPAGPLAMGADIVLHSTHKTLGSLTQSAMLHLQGERIESKAVRKSLEILQSSSPSYLFLASLEKACEQLLWYKHWEDLKEEVEELHTLLANRIRILTGKDEGTYGIGKVDWSKILVNTSTLSLNAYQTVKILRDEFKIEPELWDENNILFILGIGNQPEDIRYLRHALEWISDHYSQGVMSQKVRGKIQSVKHIPPLRLTPRQAFLAERKRLIALKESIGKIAAETIAPYPPGIPVITAGEEITKEVFDILQDSQYRWQGWENSRKNQILIIDC